MPGCRDVSLVQRVLGLRSKALSGLLPAGLVKPFQPLVGSSPEPEPAVNATPMFAATSAARPTCVGSVLFDGHANWSTTTEPSPWTPCHSALPAVKPTVLCAALPYLVCSLPALNRLQATARVSTALCPPVADSVYDTSVPPAPGQSRSALLIPVVSGESPVTTAPCTWSASTAVSAAPAGRNGATDGRVAGVAPLTHRVPPAAIQAVTSEAAACSEASGVSLPAEASTSRMSRSARASASTAVSAPKSAAAALRVAAAAPCGSAVSTPSRPVGAVGPATYPSRLRSSWAAIGSAACAATTGNWHRT